jgi:ketosteroid isomerase-like protein
MKTLLVAILCSLSLVAATPEAQTEKDIKAALAAWKQAAIQRDRAALEKLFAPDLVYTHSNAMVEDRAQTLERFTAGPNRYETVNMEEPSIRVYGAAAAVKFRMQIHMNRAGTPADLSLDILDVYVKGAAGWQLAARQSTPVPRPN